VLLSCDVLSCVTRRAVHSYNAVSVSVYDVNHECLNALRNTDIVSCVAARSLV